MLQDWLILNYSLETAAQRNGLCFISSTATRHCCHATVSRWHHTEGKSCFSGCQFLLGGLAGGWAHQLSGLSSSRCCWTRGGWGHATQQCSPSPSHSCDESFPAFALGERVWAEPCADAFHIPLCLNSHFLQKNWAHLAFKCSCGKVKWKVGFARWNFKTANLRNAGKSFERECGR